MVLIVLLLGGTLQLAARAWLTSDGGRRFIEAQVNGRDVAGYGAVTVAGLDGDPLSSPRFASVTISDGAGAWLEIEDIVIDWSPVGLLQRNMDIRALDIGTARVIRRPVRTPQTKGATPDWAFNLGSLQLDNLIIEEGVAGVASRSSVEGRIRRDASGVSVLAFALKPQDSGGDRIDLEATWGGGQELELHLDAASPAGGALGALAGLDPTSAMTLKATAAGSFTNAIGEATLQIAERDTIIAAGKIESGELVATARVDAERLPVPEDWRRVIGPGADASLSATIRDGRAVFLVDSSLASGQLDLGGDFLIAERQLAGPLTVRADLSSLAPFSQLPLGVLLDGAISDPHGKPSFAGEVRAVASDGSSLPFEAVAGTVEVGLVDSDISFAIDVTGFGVMRGNARAASLFGDAPKLTATGSFARNTNLVTITQALLVVPGGGLSGMGTTHVESRALDMSGTLDLDAGLLVDGISARAKGMYTATGSIESVNVTTTLGLTSITGLPILLDPLVSGNTRLDAALVIEGPLVRARALRFRSDGADVSASGVLAGSRAPDISFEGSQKLPVTLSGADVELGKFGGRLAAGSRGLLITTTSEGGTLASGDRVLENISARMDVALVDGEITGPVTLTGDSGGMPFRLNGDLRQTGGETRLSGLSGQFGALRFSGDASLSTSDGIHVDISGSANGLSLPGVSAAVADFKVRAVQGQDSALEVVGNLSASALNIDGFGPIEGLKADLNSAGDGYVYSAQVTSTQLRRPLDLKLTGEASINDNSLAGTMDVSGSLFGASVSTQSPVKWRAGPAPVFAADIALLGGTLKAELSNDTRDPTLMLDLASIEGQTLFAALGLPDLSATIGGRGRFQPFGLTPSGDFKLVASSDVDGLDTSMKMEVNAVLDARALRVTGNAVYGGRLTAAGQVSLPVRVAPDAFVGLDRSARLQGTATLAGDLGSLRTAAQAYGQDIGGVIDGRASLSGTLANPQVVSTADVSDGTYELGLTGLRLVGLEIAASLTSGALAVDLTGSGANGGKLTAKGEIRPGAGTIEADLTRLLIYERFGNSVRASGPLVMTETADARLISGKLTIDDARGSLDTLPSSRTQALDIRWREGSETSEARRVLEKPLTIDIQANAPRRIMVTGRGLTSEWGLDVRATGIPTAPSLVGTATLVRGEIDLAGRPFLFDRGIVRFDGPIENARVDLSAERSVNGFSARMDITGAPTMPRFVFTSTPELPQDEILSRLLFGRSSIDLSALEAAQLAASIARLSGRGSVFDPLGQLQAAIGLDRLSVGMGESGQTEVGVGQFIADSVYLELKSAGATGNAVLLEWEPAPQIAVSSETRINGDTRLSIRWKKDYD